MSCYEEKHKNGRESSNFYVADDDESVFQISETQMSGKTNCVQVSSFNPTFYI